MFGKSDIFITDQIRGALQEPPAPENWELAKRVFERMNVNYIAVMRRFTSLSSTLDQAQMHPRSRNGGVRNRKGETGSAVPSTGWFNSKRRQSEILK